MEIPEIKYFEKLKELIVQKMQQSHPEVPSSISDWRGHTIRSFQIELRERQNENISEKWFYTHMKSDNDKLPRIDTLNLLSRYAGYKSWDDFKFRYTKQLTIPHELKDRSNRVFVIVPVLVIAVFVVFYLAFSTIYNQDYTFCFYNNDTNEPIRDQAIELIILDENNSQFHYNSDEIGCISFKTTNRMLSFVVEIPYYMRDTIVLTLNKYNRRENIKLNPDNYALMIHYYSINNEGDWLKRQESLDKMFTDSAIISQVMSETPEMVAYTKREFIDMLTISDNRLRQIEIIDTKYKNGKIVQLRFRQSRR